MRAIRFVIILIAVVSAGTIRAEDAKPLILRARPIQIISCDTLPTQVKPAVGHIRFKPGFGIFYLVEGTDLRGVKAGSLFIDSIFTPDGTDISRKRNGEPAYNQGAFPTVSDDGTYCIFSVEVGDSSQFGKVERLIVKGSIVALTGSEHEKKTVELDVNDGSEKKVGPFSIQVAGLVPMASPVVAGGYSPVISSDIPTAKVTPLGDQATVVQAPTKSARPPFGSSPNDGSAFVQINLAGPMSNIINATFKNGDRELQTGYTSYFPDRQRCYGFPRPHTGKLTLTLAYWAGLHEAKVQIGQ
jgi:hypothetical protein